MASPAGAVAAGAPAIGTATRTGTGRFKPAAKKLRTHILDTYLYAKLKNFMGKDIADSSAIHFVYPYNNDEGVIKAHELVEGLRIDIQKAQQHNGNFYACIQVQWGTGANGTTGGAFGGVLVRTGKWFFASGVKAALKASLEDADGGSYYRLD